MDTWKKQDVFEFVKQWVHNYLNHNPSETAVTLEDGITNCKGYISVIDTQLEFLPVSDPIGIAYGMIHAQSDNHAHLPEELRISLVIEQTAGHFKPVHFHVSYADSVDEHDTPYPSSPENINTLRLALNAREHQLVNITENIPGGVHQCGRDNSLPLISMSNGFLGMFGYSKEEISSLFNNKFINMVYPSDRIKLLQSIENQLQTSKDFELEYRVMCRNGNTVWVLDKGRLMDDGSGTECFYCILIEITDRKRAQEELRLSLERYQVIMDQATDIIFEWDILRDTLTFSSNWFKKFGYDAIDTYISERIPRSKNIHPDDIPAFVKIMKEISSGIPFSEAEFRLRDNTGIYYWCRIRVTTQFDNESRPIKAIGIIVDIDTEKKQKQALVDQAQLDALTGLYNKATVNARVEQLMQNRGLAGFQALLIIDADHFKAVNDTYGHLCGDSVLSDLAVVLKSCTRSTDIVGRIGGDEFLIYFPEITCEEAVRQKTQNLLDSLRLITPAKGAAPISCSIGAAVFPRGSIDYYALFKCADQALYQMKKSGRRGVAFFGEDTNPEEIPCGLSGSAVSDTIVSDARNVMDEGLSQYSFRTLYEAHNTEFAINRLLEIIGRSFDVSRVYIFESSKDGQYCSNTFEWCNECISPQMDKLQNIAYVDELGDYLRNFDSSGMFYCHDVQELHPDVYNVLAPQGIRSMLQCAMLDEGEFIGYVGFDECRENRFWTPHQIANFKLTANVLSTFVMKLRLKQRLQANDDGGYRR